MIRIFILILFMMIGLRHMVLANGETMAVKVDTSASNLSSSFRKAVSLKSKTGFIPSLIHNFGEQAAAPFRMSRSQAWQVGACIGITGGLILLDEEIDRFFKPLKEKHQWIDRSSSSITELGGEYATFFMTGYCAYALVFNDDKGFRTALLSIQAAITSGVWVRLGKTITGRERPVATYSDKGFHRDYWWGPLAQFDNEINEQRGTAFFDAFPSGHTSTAFSIATVFAYQYSDKKFVAPFAYTLASLVGITRLTEHDHWASDVFAGACMGFLCGRQVVMHQRKLDKEMTAAAKKKPVFFLALQTERPGFTCFMNF